MVAKVLDANGNKKEIGLHQQNNHFAHDHAFFVHILAAVSWLPHETFLILIGAHFIVPEHNTKNVLFLNLGRVQTPNFSWAEPNLN